MNEAAATAYLEWLNPEHEGTLKLSNGTVLWAGRPMDAMTYKRIVTEMTRHAEILRAAGIFDERK